MKVCSFTGHRVIKAEHADKLAGFLDRAIEFAYSKGCRDFLTGGAIGFDTVAAEEVVKFRASHTDVRFVLVLPCVDQDAKWSAAQKARYAELLSEADEVTYVSRLFNSTCIKERNAYLAEHCDMLVSYVSHRNSGSAQTAAMAKARGKEIYNLYPAMEAELNGNG